MNRFVSNLILGLFVVALVIVYGVSKQPAVFSLGHLLTNQIVQPPVDQQMAIRLPGGQVIQARVVDTPEARAQGLSGVESVPADTGMLFVFQDDGTQGIWMKGMKIPLDILWLDGQGQVVHIVQNAPIPDDEQTVLPIYESNQPARYVLELAAGTVEATGLEAGQVVGLS
nr:hypothetical protein [uncultured bacterium]